MTISEKAQYRAIWWAVFIGIWIMVVPALNWAIRQVAEIDDSDLSHDVRSGVAVRTDYLSGCQYLQTYWGGITPRLDRGGKQVCNAKGAKP